MKVESRSIRNGVTWRLCVFAILLSLIYSLLIILVAFIVEDAVIENILDTETQHIQTYYLETKQIPVPKLAFVTLYASFAEAEKSLPGKVSLTLSNEEVFVDGPAHYHVRKIALKQGDETNSVVMVAEVGDLLSVSRLSLNIIVLFVSILILGLLLAVWQAYLLANKTTKPIRALAKKVAHLANQSTSKAIKQAPINNEIAYLSGVIDLVFSNLEQSLSRERAFTQDVSHELRTPLTVFQNTLALIELREWQSGDHKALSYATDKMQMTINTLLTMAREDACDIKSVVFRPILEQAVLNCFERLEGAGIGISLCVEDNIEVLGNADLISLIVVNLLENTVRHAPYGDLLISATPSKIVFNNTLVDKADNNKLTDVNTQSGLGLVLVKRMAAQMKWQTEVLSNEDEFSVVFYLE